MHLLTQANLSVPIWTQDFLNHHQKLYVTDEDKVRFVLALTEQNIKHSTGGPFGAAIFDMKTHQLISIGVNRVMPETFND